MLCVTSGGFGGFSADYNYVRKCLLYQWSRARDRQTDNKSERETEREEDRKIDTDRRRQTIRKRCVWGETRERGRERGIETETKRQRQRETDSDRGTETERQRETAHTEVLGFLSPGKHGGDGEG